MKDKYRNTAGSSDLGGHEKENIIWINELVSNDKDSLLQPHHYLDSAPSKQCYRVRVRAKVTMAGIGRDAN